jgi:acyl-CoA reductase-like NAD-dependent aldehyde dehydrogenase
VRPAIIDVTGVAVPDEEMFAPFLSVTRVASFDAAIAEANATRYGLSAGLVSDDPANWQRFIRRIRAGGPSTARPPAPPATCPSAASGRVATTDRAPGTPPTTAPIRWPVLKRER